MNSSSTATGERPQTHSDCGDPRPLPDSTLKSRLARVANEHPMLGEPGFYTPALGSFDDFLKHRRDLYLHVDRIAAVQRFIWSDWPILYNEGRVHSYALKHRAETYLTEIGEHVYCSNGSAIAAALVSGFTIKPERRNSPNAIVIFRSRGRIWAGCSRMSPDGWA